MFNGVYERERQTDGRGGRSKGGRAGRTVNKRQKKESFFKHQRI